MYKKLIEAAKLDLKKGIYQLSFDEKSNIVKVSDRRTGELNYTVKSENDNMLLATIIYFGLRTKELDSVKAY